MGCMMMGVVTLSGRRVGLYEPLTNGLVEAILYGIGPGLF